MSSLAATQADGYYLPPEYFEGGAYKKQSKNAFAANQSGEKQGHNQWLQRGVVRFELPYKGVCEGPACPQPSIMRGTRYNAKKVTTEETYFTTPIYEFQMQCRLCQHPWVIRTNPKERGFDYMSGIHIQAGQESIVQSSSEVEADGGNDALDRLESTAQGKRRAMTEMEELQKLQKLNESSLTDADHNAMIRKGFRNDRAAKRKRQENAAQLGWKKGMEVLSEDAPIDIVASKEATYGNPKEKEQKRLRTVRSSSIFSSSTTSKTSKRLRRRRDKNQSSSMMSPDPVHSISLSTANIKTADIENDNGDTKSSMISEMTKVKKRLRLGASSLGGLVLQKSEPSSLVESETSNAKGLESQERQTAAKAKSSSLSEMLAAYESSDDEDM